MRREEGRGGGGEEMEEKEESREDVTHLSDSRAGIASTATPTATAPPSLIGVPPRMLSLHE